MRYHTLMPAAALYCRISKDAEARGLGVARQEKECRALAKRKGWTVAEVYVDNDLSASALKRPRPRYRDMLRDVTEGKITAIVARHDDRLHRHPRELEDFIDLVEATGVEVMLLDGLREFTTARGRADARSEVTRSKYESERKGERLRLMHQEKAEQGSWKGGPRPYGYDLPRDADGDRIKGTGKLLVVPEEAAVITEAARRVLGGESVYAVCADFNARGIPTAQRAKWRTPTLRRILTNPTTAGRREHRGEDVGDASWPAILDQASWRRLRAIVTDPTRSRMHPARAYLLTGGIARCGRCGSPLHAQRKSSGARTYACIAGPDKDGCGGLSIHAEPLERLVTEAVMVAIEGPTLVRAIAAQAGGGFDHHAEVIAVEEAKLMQLADDWDDGRISRAEWIRLRDKVQARLDAARREQSRETRTTAVDPYVGRQGALRAAWPALTLDQRRAVVAGVLDSVVISPATRRGPIFDPSRIDPATGLVWRF